MARYRTCIEVPAPPSEVCAYLADHRNGTAWDPTIVESILASGEPIVQGSEFDVLATFYGRRFELRYTVTELDAPRRIVFDGDGSKVRTRLTFDIDAAGAGPDDGGSRIDYDAEVSLTGVLRVLGKGLNAAIEGIGDKAADGIRRALSG